MPRCRACKDRFDDRAERTKALIESNQPIHASEFTYCATCASELFRGATPMLFANLHAGGRSDPSWRNDSNQPQENAVRDLEEQ